GSSWRGRRVRKVAGRDHNPRVAERNFEISQKGRPYVPANVEPFQKILFRIFALAAALQQATHLVLKSPIYQNSNSIRHLFQGRKEKSQGMLNLSESVRSQCPEVGPAIVENHFRRMPFSYFERYSPAEIGRHLRLLGGLQGLHAVDIDAR